VRAWEELRNWLIAHKAIGENVAEPDEIKRLDLSNRGLTSIPETLGMLRGVVALNLGHNHLGELPSSLSSMTMLGNVDLRRNDFETVPEVLCTLSLRSLNLSGNRIVDAAALRACTALRVLDLSGNVLQAFDDCLGEPNELRTLNLSCNFIKDISGLLSKLEGVERLNLSGNVIAAIPPSAATLASIVELNLSDNRIAQIDEAFFGLEAETIDLASNRIDTLRLHGLDSLEVLTLDANPIASVSIADDFAPYLREFSCDGCGLETFLLPPSVSLESLCYSSNAITKIPEAVSRYTQLSQLDVDGNAIRELPDGLANMTRLRTLYIDGNPLSEAAKQIVEVLHPDICDINMKTGITIEKAAKADLPHMAKLLSILFAIEQDFEIDFDKQLSGITKLFLHEGTDLLVAKHEGNVVGMVTMQRLISSAEGDYVGQIEDLVVRDDYRKMGVGSRLINKMRFMAQEYGYKRIQLVADLDNENALQFYTRRGFRRTNLTVFHFKNS
jgi:Leucine-rich repeat (LRR) protein/GNAT superfamily N-acetyltransferase